MMRYLVRVSSSQYATVDAASAFTIGDCIILHDGAVGVVYAEVPDDPELLDPGRETHLPDEWDMWMKEDAG